MEVSNKAEGAGAQKEGGESRTIGGEVAVDRVGGHIGATAAAGVYMVHNVIAEREADGEVENPRGGEHKTGLVGGGLNPVETGKSATHGLEEGFPREEPYARDVVGLALASRSGRLTKGLGTVAAENNLEVSRGYAKDISRKSRG